jgi:hypothetical protein
VAVDSSSGSGRVAVKHPRHVVRGPRRAPGVAVPVKIAQQKLAVAVAVGKWQWLNDSGSGSGWVTVAVWQWMMGGSVAVWQMKEWRGLDEY